MRGLAAALPTRTATDLRWTRAIRSALLSGKRHNPECTQRKQPTIGCPWCAHIAHEVNA